MIHYFDFSNDAAGCRLVHDYERWATDDAYRRKRAQRADSTALRG